MDVHKRRHRLAVPVEQAELELRIGVDAVALVEVQVDGYPAGVLDSAAVGEAVDGPAASSEGEGAGHEGVALDETIDPGVPFHGQQVRPGHGLGDNG